MKLLSSYSLTASMSVLICGLLTIQIAQAANQNTEARKQSIAADVLIGEDDVSGLRLSYRPLTHQVKNIPYFDTLDVYWELSINFWEYGDNNQHQTNYVLALSPVVSKVFYQVADKYPLRWEFGIGVSLVDDTRFAGKDIGSHYQFEDRLGLSLSFGEDLRQMASIRYMHYSNGGLNSKNPGMDFLNMAYSYQF
ncbi:acyloxyacyl hydrolase [Brumicola nitratireducens]|uniref:Lipid A deacylase n=1 Tax=Glaciecola nitratireducens (strain JCM 12485 / KCTC 12276 / FR1064) TaxID=1085623 RepID=G4QNS6_GLANF|nr:acyloxyacyl hydrolase [Glaciecola nitratireducens]AEP31634.1 hypothetical protein GNIT_3540 [Glaciecola nitratireducens FR1064]